MAFQFLDDITELDVSPEILGGIVVVCQFMHASVVNASALYLQELSRHNYVTPTSYLELLSSYTDLLNKKKGSLTEGLGRLKIGKSTKFSLKLFQPSSLSFSLALGLDKLQSTTEEVKELQIQLEVMKPALEIAARDADIMIKQIAADTVS